MIIGHKDLVRDFKQLVKSNRLSHGYIFFGEPEIGKFFFAKHLAYLLETGDFEITERPLQDSLILESSEGIDAMRELKNFLWQKPNVSGKRLAVINNAENLTPQAQNAILKIAEEPPENAMIILIVNQPDNILPPLLSRLQKIYFGRLSDEEMKGVTDEKGILALSFGRPGKASRLEESDENTKTAESYASQFIRSSGPARSKLIKELIDLNREQAEDAGENNGGRAELLDLFFESLILNLQKDPIRNNLILRDVLHRLFLIKSYNVNKRLQLEAI